MVVIKICPECKKKYSDVSLAFCLEDGTKLIEDKTGHALPPTVLFPRPESVETPGSGSETAESKTNSLLMLGAGAILFALVAGILGFVFLRSRSLPQGNGSPTNTVIMDSKKLDNSANRQTSTNFTDGSKNPPDECSLSDADKLSIKEISFAPASFKVTPESETILKNLSTRFRQLPENCFVEIGVHTDDVGDTTMNTQLSMSRGLAIEKYLINSGVSSDKLSVFGYGGSQPIAPNTTDENRRMNRRVEFKLFTKDKPADTSANSNADVFDLKNQSSLDKLKSEGINVVAGNSPASGKPNPLLLVVGIGANGDLTLNNEKMGNVSGKNILSEKLKEVFKMREEMQIYREGANTVEKTLTIKTASPIKREIFDETLKIIKDAGASPINLSVEN